MTTVVIGGGIAGVSVAAELAGSRDVLLVETEPMLARHTTGRSAAVYLPSYGGGVIRALTAAGRTRFAPGLLRPRPMLWVSTDDDGDQHVQDTVAAGTAGPITIAEARDLCPALRPDAFRSIALDAGTMDIDAMGLHQHYVRELKARGGEIRMAARVTALTRDGGGWRVTLGHDEIHADEVVNAAGAWADQVAALAGVPSIGLTPLKRTIAIAVGGPVDPAWPLVADAAERFYFRPEGEGVLLSPADETPTEPCDAKPDELDIALAIDRVNEVTTLGLRSVRTAWAGLRSFTPGRSPVVGQAPGHPGFHFFAGQGGYGIQIAPALAAAGAAVIRGEAIPADIGVTAEDLRSPLWTA
ncbi:NAD(P)/FAD-dependent oxidoreductase [Actinokineospora xionganensis]|uniref:FAD-binding oxidoreductase n=1 Tax=Actinokineospora xionganensis TaxID=2684470 RepID=A0ABR7LBA0_9PSEU|nr:FAD-binding oxidoreductase [Actinokineospora xionganensis]MBC6449572.1 FAD-binding oxidoreductase [Actinokineospora xionganensis]